jgi:hypothetical protein
MNEASHLGLLILQQSLVRDRVNLDHLVVVMLCWIESSKPVENNFPSQSVTLRQRENVAEKSICLNQSLITCKTSLTPDPRALASPDVARPNFERLECPHEHTSAALGIARASL